MKILVIIPFFLINLFSYELNITKGWQLKGALEDINVYSFENQDINSVWSYDNTNKKWKAFFNSDINLSSYNIEKLEIIKKGEGFWINSKKSLVIDTFNKSLILPLYFYNLDWWNKVSSENLSKMYVIVNPNSGPGSSIDANYEEFINNLVSNNKIPIGYVYTKYTQRDIADVENDIDTWISFYPEIKGFFIDEVSNDENSLEYYKSLANYIKSKGDYKIVLNPGTKVYSGYFDIANLVVVFEDKYDNYDNSVCNQNPLKSAVIVYRANKEEMQKIISDSNCSYFYITDDDLPNPYDTLPTYFDEEINELK